MAQLIDKWWYLLTGGLLVLGVATWIGFAETGNEDVRRGSVLSWSLVALIAAAPFAIAASDSPVTDALWSLYVTLLGAVFLCAFLVPNRAFVFRGLQRVSKFVFYPSSKYWLLVLGALLLSVGVYELVRRYAV
jgi:xanthine/uracil permease